MLLIAHADPADAVVETPALVLRLLHHELAGAQLGHAQLQPLAAWCELDGQPVGHRDQPEMLWQRDCCLAVQGLAGTAGRPGHVLRRRSRGRARGAGRLCGPVPYFPASLGALADLEALLLLGITVTGLIPYDAGYNWLSLAAGAIVGPLLSVRLSAASSADPRPRPRPDRPAPPSDAP